MLARLGHACRLFGHSLDTSRPPRFSKTRGWAVMSTIMHVCILLFLPSAGNDIPPVMEKAAYESARSRPGMGADDHVRLALLFEANGMTAERLQHLAVS